LGAILLILLNLSMTYEPNTVTFCSGHSFNKQLDLWLYNIFLLLTHHWSIKTNWQRHFHKEWLKNTNEEKWNTKRIQNLFGIKKNWKWKCLCQLVLILQWCVKSKKILYNHKSSCLLKEWPEQKVTVLGSYVILKFNNIKSSAAENYLIKYLQETLDSISSGARNCVLFKYVIKMLHCIRIQICSNILD
jgi:hypothetical protein